MSSKGFTTPANRTGKPEESLDRSTTLGGDPPEVLWTVRPCMAAAGGGYSFVVAF